MITKSYDIFPRTGTHRNKYLLVSTQRLVTELSKVVLILLMITHVIWYLRSKPRGVLEGSKCDVIRKNESR
jgi:hypothetical protein